MENMEAESLLKRAGDLIGRAEDTLIWCSGSSDFNEGGKAAEGWDKLARPLLTELREMRTTLGCGPIPEPGEPTQDLVDDTSDFPTVKEGSGASTEKEMRESVVPHIASLDHLASYIGALIDRPHDYGTCVYAMSMAATAAFHYVASRLGASGFQASCADFDVLRRLRGIDGPFMLIKGEDMLYPQYDLVDRLLDALVEWREWAGEEAKKKLLNTEGGPAYQAHPHVRDHWVRLAETADEYPFVPERRDEVMARFIEIHDKMGEMLGALEAEDDRVASGEPSLEERYVAVEREYYADMIKQVAIEPEGCRQGQGTEAELVRDVINASDAGFVAEILYHGEDPVGPPPPAKLYHCNRCDAEFQSEDTTCPNRDCNSQEVKEVHRP